MAAEIPDRVRRFIAEHINSAMLLDVLLLLRAAPDKLWSAEEVGHALVTGEPAAAGQLATLHAQGLVTPGRGGFRYAPGSQAGVIDELAEDYARRRHSVITAIYAADREAATLADAFRFRRRKR